jgi:4-amino-4-deoxy-L-arabinose transferase-like glycosyltransferase
MIAASFRIFGVHDWASRIPIGICTVLLCWVTARFAAWGFGKRAGLYAGLIMSTSIGLFLFTRILIPDVILTLTITLALWGMLQAIDGSRWWAWGMWAAIAAGLLLKGLIAALFPVAIGLLFLALTRQLYLWRRFRPLAGVALLLAIAAPWHVLATLRNPPYFDFTMHSESGSYHGFFWFYFINEHLLRFLNLRYPRDYNTVPRLWFWLFHLLWFFPWSMYFPAVFRLAASRLKLLAFCWAGFVLGFFTFSTTQEYYSMPCYPALAMLLGAAMASKSRWLAYGDRAITAIAAMAAVTIGAILWMVQGVAAPGDISSALSQNPDVYTLSLGHMTDLTLRAFAYLRVPLALAGVAFAIGALGGCFRNWAGESPAPRVAMMVLFFHAARLALVAFDPYMGSRTVADALLQAPPGKLIVDGQYYTFSSIFFYTNRQALLVNGRVNNLEYGSYAPGAPRDVFIDDQDLVRIWSSAERYYLVAEGPQMPRLSKLLGNSIFPVKQSGGKFLVTNQ